VQILKETHFDFIGFRYIAYTISGVVILAGLVSLILKGGPTYGVDFKGGVVVQAKFDRPVTTDEVRSVLENAGAVQISVQHGATRDEAIISTPEVQTAGGKDVSDLIREILVKPDNTWKVDEKGITIDKVNPSVGRDLISAAIRAVILGLGLILVYVWLRFDLRFGVGGIVALFHDVFVTLGFFSIFNKEINLSAVGAFLTIVGFSINDTIVIFDRVRENLKLHRGKDFDEILNLSINQTLSRTIITTGTALLTVISIFAIARVGDLHILSLALLVGFISGVYSTVYIASPIARLNILQRRMKAPVKVAAKTAAS